MRGRSNWLCFIHWHACLFGILIIEVENNRLACVHGLDFGSRFVLATTTAAAATTSTRTRLAIDRRSRVMRRLRWRGVRTFGDGLDNRRGRRNR